MSKKDQGTGGAGKTEKYEDTAKGSAEDIIKRRSRWESSLAALRYVNSISQDEQVKIRDTDKATALWLWIVLILIPVSLLIPWLSPHRLPLILVSDVLVGAVLLMFLGNRLGIITTLTPRQARLTWQIMMGAVLWGVFMTINLLLIIAIVLSNTSYISLTQ